MVGIYIRQFFSMGTVPAALLMLQNIIDEKYKNLAINIFYCFIAIIYSASAMTIGSVKTKEHLSPE